MGELAHIIKLNDPESISSSTETWSEANWKQALQLTKLKPDCHGVDCGELRGYNFEPKTYQMYAGRALRLAGIAATIEPIRYAAV